MPIRIVIVLSLMVLASAARGERSDARGYYQRATAHYAIGEFDQAAADYQLAYKLKQDPALLYNAAQAFRLAGRLDRALVLYRNYINLYPDAGNIKEVRQQVAKLKSAVASAATAVTSPPTGTTRPAEEPPAHPPIVVGDRPSAAAPQAPAPSPRVAPREQHARRTPVYKKWWLWTIVGAVAAGGAVTAAVLVTQPSGTWSNHPDVGPGSMAGALVRW